MNADERTSKRAAIMGMLVQLCVDEMEIGGAKAMGMPIIMQRVLGIAREPDERVATYTNVPEMRRVWEEFVAEDDARPHVHSPECDGRCGPKWFFGALVDHILTLAQSDAAVVEAFLNDGGQQR